MYACCLHQEQLVRDNFYAKLIYLANFKDTEIVKKFCDYFCRVDGREFVPFRRGNDQVGMQCLTCFVIEVNEE